MRQDEVMKQIRKIADEMITKTCSTVSPFFGYLSDALVNQQVLNEIVHISEDKVIPVSERTGNRDYLTTMDLLNNLKSEAMRIYHTRVQYYHYFKKQGKDIQVAEDFYQNPANNKQSKELQLEMERTFEEMMNIFYSEKNYTASDYANLANKMQTLLSKMEMRDYEMLKEFESSFRRLLTQRDEVKYSLSEKEPSSMNMRMRSNPLSDLSSNQFNSNKDEIEIPVRRRIRPTIVVDNSISEDLPRRKESPQENSRSAQELRMRTSSSSPNHKRELVIKKEKAKRGEKKHKKWPIVGLASLLMIGGIVYSVNGDKELEVISIPKDHSSTIYAAQEVVIPSTIQVEPVLQTEVDFVISSTYLKENTNERIRKEKISKKVERLDDELVDQLVEAIKVVNADIPYIWRGLRIEPDCENNRDFLLESLEIMDGRINDPGYTKGREGYQVACHLRRMTETMVDYKIGKGFGVSPEKVKYVYAFDRYGNAQKCDIMAGSKLLGRSTTTKNKIPQDFKKIILQYGTVDQDIKKTSFGFDESGKLTEDTKNLYDMFETLLEKEYEVPKQDMERS